MSQRAHNPPSPSARRLVGMLVLLAFLLGVFAGRFNSIAAVFRIGPDWRSAVDEVRGIIAAEYIEPVTDEQLARSAITGMVQGLSDRYSEFLPPAEAAEFVRQTTFAFSGIGAGIAVRDGMLAIVSPLPGSPALAAGLRPDDRIAAIDGQSTLGWDIDRAREHLLGPAGTPVTLTVLRGPISHGGGPPVELTVSVTRAPVVAPSVMGVRHLPGRDGAAGGWDYVLDARAGAVYLRLAQFTPTAAGELAAAIAQSAAQLGGPAKAVVLDLRGNSGGLLDQAVAVADVFLDSGPIVTTRPRAGAEIPPRTYSATPGTLVGDAAVVVLIDELSASASEVVAGALQETGGALIVGSRTFGKGLVQHVLDLRSVPGAKLRLTEQRFYLPSGRLIHRTDTSTSWGVDPTPGYAIATTEADLLRAVAARRRLEAVRPDGDDGGPPAELPGEPAIDLSAPRLDDPAWIASQLGDLVLAEALRAAQARVATGRWPVPPAVAASAPSTLTDAEARRLLQARDRLLRDVDRIERRLSGAAPAGDVPPAAGGGSGAAP